MKKNKINTFGISLLIGAFAFMSIASGSPSSNGGNSNENRNADSGSEAPPTTTTTAEPTPEPELPFEVADESTNLNIGQIAKYGDFYVGLSCVRSLEEVQTAINIYTEDVSDSQEVIYTIMQVYNDSDDLESFNKLDIALYADSVQAPEPDTVYLVGIDDFEELQMYDIDPQKTAVVVQAFVVEEGWTEITVFCGSVSWTISPDDISYDPYTYSPLFETTEEYSYTETDTTIYNDEYELTYNGFEIYSYDSALEGTEYYAVFEFSVNNTSDSELDYSFVGYSMRGYCNNQLLDEATYIMDDNINGYTNIFDVDEIHPGMTANIYVAYPITETSGTYECFYDVGYITNENIAYVCIEA